MRLVESCRNWIMPQLYLKGVMSKMEVSQMEASRMEASRMEASRMEASRIEVIEKDLASEDIRGVPAAALAILPINRRI